MALTHSAPAARKRILLAGVLWVLSVQNPIAEYVAAAAWKIEFSVPRNAISDPGNTARSPFEQPDRSVVELCSPLHMQMNVSLVVYGVLLPLGTLLTARWWPRSSGAAAGE